MYVHFKKRLINYIKHCNPARRTNMFLVHTFVWLISIKIHQANIAHRSHRSRRTNCQVLSWRRPIQFAHQDCSGNCVSNQQTHKGGQQMVDGDQMHRLRNEELIYELDLVVFHDHWKKIRWLTNDSTDTFLKPARNWHSRLVCSQMSLSNASLNRAIAFVLLMPCWWL